MDDTLRPPYTYRARVTSVCLPPGAPAGLLGVWARLDLGFGTRITDCFPLYGLRRAPHAEGPHAVDADLRYQARVRAALGRLSLEPAPALLEGAGEYEPVFLARTHRRAEPGQELAWQIELLGRGEDGQTVSVNRALVELGLAETDLEGWQ